MSVKDCSIVLRQRRVHEKTHPLDQGRCFVPCMAKLGDPPGPYTGFSGWFSLTTSYMGEIDMRRIVDPFVSGWKWMVFSGGGHMRVRYR